MREPTLRGELNHYGPGKWTITPSRVGAPRPALSFRPDFPYPAGVQFNHAQFDRLAQGALGSFLLQMRGHLRESFPQECAALADPQLDTISRDGVARAGEYGVRAQREVCKFIDLMFVLGSDFDHRAAWISAALRNQEVSPEERVTRLVQTVMAALRQG